MHRVTLLSVWILAIGTWGTPLDGQWIEWFEVTDTHLSADPAVGSQDTQEKDYTVADFDNDGDPDVVVVRKTPADVYGPDENVLLRNENGTLTDVTAQLAPDLMTPDNSRDVVAADLDQDGWIDLVIANAGYSPASGEQPRVFMNVGLDPMGNWLGFVEDPTRIPVLETPGGQGPISSSISAGDVTGNGAPDLYLGDNINSLEDKLLINDGLGFFTDGTSSLPPGFATSRYLTKVQIEDMNNDGFMDIIKNSTPNVTIAYNAGGGTFTTTQNLSVNSVYHFKVGDLNGDSQNDIYVMQDSQDQFQINESPPGTIPVSWNSTTLGNSPLTTGFGGNVHIVDLDGDNDNDVVVCDNDEDGHSGLRLAFLQNDGSTPIPSIFDPYDDPWTPAHKDGTFDVAIADFNGDTWTDILVGHCEGTSLFFQVPPMFPFVRGDCNGDGQPDIADAIYGLSVLFTELGRAPCLDACDVNDDGAWDIGDMIYLLITLFGGGPKPPTPYPDCGSDPTVDLLDCGVYMLCR